MENDTATTEQLTNITDKKVMPLFPFAALVLYSKPYSCEGDTVYPAMHMMKGIPGKADFTFGEAMPLTAENCERFTEILQAHSRISNSGDMVATDYILRKPIPPRMLIAYKHEATPVVVWWEKSEKKVISHRMGKNREGECFVARMPIMLFMVLGDTLYAYALKEEPKRDDDGALSFQLCHAPLWNISDNGKVCLGSAKVTMRDQVDFTWMMKEYSRAFWGSFFTSEHGHPRPQRWRGTLLQFWTKMEERIRDKGFPNILLRPLHDMNVPEILKPFNIKTNESKARNK